VTTTTPDLLAHVAAVRDGACDDNDLLVLADHLAEADDADRADLFKAQVELERLRRDGHGLSCTRVIDILNSPVGRRPGAAGFPVCLGCQDEMWAEQRERDLLARNPAWLSAPCPECGGGGPRFTPHPNCRLCGNTGDLLREWVDQNGVSVVNDIRPRAAITRGFVDITLPHTLCWGLEEMPSTRCPACRGRGARAWHAGVSGQGCGECGNHDTIDLLRPHPVLRAVLASPVGPWVRRVRVEGREPRGEPGYEDSFSHDWFDESRVAPYPESGVPKPIFGILRLLGGESYRPTDCYVEFPTAEAATDALARAVPIWARGAK